MVLAAGVCIEIVPFGGPLGAEVRGLDLVDDPPGEIVFQILETFHAHHVLLFRDQELTRDRLLEVGQWFGPIFTPPPDLPVLGGADQHPVVAVSNVVEGGVAGDGPLPTHSDLHNMPTPAAVSLLYALEVPERGGETSWSNLHQAYDELEPKLCERIRGLRGISPNPYVGERPKALEAAGPNQLFRTDPVPEYSHPIVRLHPATGRPSLYVSPLVDRLLGVEDAEAAKLLARLHAHVDREHLYWTHHWRAGDLVVADNRCTNHKRAPFEPGQRRTLLRVMLGGGRPF